MTQGTTTRQHLAKKMASRACLAAAVAASSRGGVSAFSTSSIGRSGLMARSLSSVNSNNLYSLYPTSTQAIKKNDSGNRISSVAPSRSFQLNMSTVAAGASTARRVKTAEADVSDEQVSIKGWVRTVRKQKTLAFVEVNDGSNMSGIQCVLPFDSVDEDTMKGKYILCVLFIHRICSYYQSKRNTNKRILRVKSIS